MPYIGDGAYVTRSLSPPSTTAETPSPMTGRGNAYRFSKTTVSLKYTVTYYTGVTSNILMLLFWHVRNILFGTLNYVRGSLRQPYIIVIRPYPTIIITHYTLRLFFIYSAKRLLHVDRWPLHNNNACHVHDIIINIAIKLVIGCAW